MLVTEVLYQLCLTAMLGTTLAGLFNASLSPISETDFRLNLRQIRRGLRVIPSWKILLSVFDLVFSRETAMIISRDFILTKEG